MVSFIIIFLCIVISLIRMVASEIIDQEISIDSAFKPRLGIEFD